LLNEAFESRKFQKGQVKFIKSQLADKHLQQILDKLHLSGHDKQELIDNIEAKVNEFKDMQQIAPTLYSTILDNIYEGEVFNLVQEHKPHFETSPKFDTMVFFKLERTIKAEHTQFFPMRSFINPKRLRQPSYAFMPEDADKYPQYADVDTAAATPSGDFIFNTNFMQSLMDFAHVKGVKPKGKKYKCNGGRIPDEYCYIEFLIMHEFMHFTYDDFYYQNMIKNANPTIINWVGDFRTNYLLVKSGYEQLPMGLFNDDINYDRQRTYKEMYDIVESEFKKLNKEQQGKVKKQMDGMSDDHEPGQGQGRGSGEGKDVDTSKIDEKNDQVEDQMKNSEDKSEAKKQEEQKKGPPNKSAIGGRGSGGNSNNTIDFDKINPNFSWDKIIKMFIATASNQTEETYQTPSRRSITGIYTASQVGAGAMKPGEMVTDLKDAKLGFCIDSSGSMSHVVEKIYSNIFNLLKMNKFLQKTLFTLIKFSTDYEIFKGNFHRNTAAKVNEVMDIPTKMELNMKDEFNRHYGSSTNFTSSLVNDLIKMLENKYNILLFSDSDIIHGENKTELERLLKVRSGKLFIILDSRETYIQFRQNIKLSSTLITYFTD
jgi:hypothetical protein